MPATTLKTPSARRVRALRPPKNPTLPDARIRVEQWAALGEVKPPYELINGLLVRKMVTTNEHDWAVGKIYVACSIWASDSGWRFFTQGAGTRLDEFNGFVPDVMGFSPDVKLAASSSYNPPPNIAFEVLSPRTAKADRGEKKRAYEQAGVQFYVLVDLKKRTLEVHQLCDGKYGKPAILAGEAIWQPDELPGLKIELAKLWFN